MYNGRRLLHEADQFKLQAAFTVSLSYKYHTFKYDFRELDTCILFTTSLRTGAADAALFSQSWLSAELTAGGVFNTNAKYEKQSNTFFRSYIWFLTIHAAEALTTVLTHSVPCNSIAAVV